MVSAVERSGPSLGALAMLKLLERDKNYEVRLLSRFKRDDNLDVDNSNIIFTGNYLNTFKLLTESISKNIICISFDIKMDLLNVICFKKSLIYVRANNLDNYTTSFGVIFGKILYNIHLFILNISSGILVLTNTQKDIFRNSGHNFVGKVHVLPNFIDEVPLRHIKKKKNSFLIVGSFIERKRIYETVGSFLAVFSDRKDVSLIIIGNGVQKDKIKSLLTVPHECSVRLIEERVNPKPFFEESEYFILMSSSEGLSRASLEASYFGCKLILSDIAVHNEFFADYAIIVESFNELSLELLRLVEGEILLKPGFPESCRSVSIERKLNSILMNFIS